MKAVTVTIAVLSLALPVVTSAQIINAGFESWSGGNPVGWTTTNSAAGTPVTQVSDAHSGSSAAKGTVILSSFSVPIIPILIGSAPSNGFQGGRPAALHGWYKFTPVGGDAFTVGVEVLKGGNPIGGGEFTTTASVGAYTELVANISYATQDTPDTALVTVETTSHTGSTFTVDDFAWGAAVSDVRETASRVPGRYALHQNYPNPFNPSTTIGYELPAASYVTLKVYNILGDEVSTLVDGQRTAGSYLAQFNAQNLPSGTYFYRLQAGSYVETRKLILLK